MDYFNIKFIPRRPGIYLVGGTVRDFLLGFDPKDIDIAVTNNPLRVAEEIAANAGGRPVRIGKPGKTIYRVTAKDRVYDVVPVNGDRIEADLMQRDFTINAMAVDIASDRLIDIGKGRRDLSERVIRMVADDSFRNDPIRLLRAYRFASVLDFKITSGTTAVISRDADRISLAAGERIRVEWLKLLGAPGAYERIASMDAAGLLGRIFPELSALKGCMQNHHHRFDAFAHTMDTCRHLEVMLATDRPALCPGQANQMLLQGPSFEALLKHAALLHDIGKAATKTVDKNGSIHFYGHEAKGADMAADTSVRIRMSKNERQYVDRIIRNHMRPLALFMIHAQQQLHRKGIVRFFMKCAPCAPELLLLSVADMLAKGDTKRSAEFLQFARDIVRSWFDEYLPRARKSPLITGHDLIHVFRLAPSPLFEAILDHIETKRRTGEIRTREEALEAIIFFLDRQKHS